MTLFILTLCYVLLLIRRWCDALAGRALILYTRACDRSGGERIGRAAAASDYIDPATSETRWHGGEGLRVDVADCLRRQRRGVST